LQTELSYKLNKPNANVLIKYHCKRSDLYHKLEFGGRFFGHCANLKMESKNNEGSLKAM